ncbi:NAD-dependent protein deacetylase of SIR2 family [Candidatus Phaeomarinobacter ectocarpi]|uniref:protein acetyllysine N-acetyltransferase n=1 Tax=Candidatus Phaeomarinibacter ectocarpi TaxID=1458461 RepID=X5MHM7_9HYPH|nr:Sir2 family NAD-dependent protein deacetylase [Candidatus Phaeomarinobacter ectocarpi]CDO61294.1 NAD-dependent protein deacetylase of SIR2 family [Candidatus Phaeomarinobacter ectocarpi]
MTTILKDYVDQAKRVVVFTGAGISTESGIPDFRSPGGLWTQNKPIYFQDFMASEAMRVEAWQRKFNMDDTFTNAQPNAGHMAIARLVQSGKVTSVITQNIDNLHQDSGIPDERIVELHGNTTYAKCLDCSTRHEIEFVRAGFEQAGTPPPCSKCGGILKTATISFGQSMPEEEMLRAEAATLACDLFIAIGSSLVVYPAAGFPIIAKQNGAALIIINREETELDEIADLVLNTEAGPTLSALLPHN